MTEQPQFRMVRRGGYDPVEVDALVTKLREALDGSRQEAAEATVAVTKLQGQVGQLGSQLDAERLRAEQLAAEVAAAKSEPPTPSWSDLGGRITAILSLAQEEADEVTSKARTAAEQLEREAAEAAEATRMTADRYAADMSSKAEAEYTRTLESARRQADDILDHADREASARRTEAEAYYEQQQARAAEAAADFEKTLSERRDIAAAEYTTQMEVQTAALAAAEEQRTAAESEAERARADSQAEAESVIAQARNEAHSLIEQARNTADRIRRESERELAAITQRRDSINTQLANVRRMLATLGGGANAALLAATEPVGDSKPAPQPEAGPEPTHQSEVIGAAGEPDAPAEPAPHVQEETYQAQWQ